LSSVGSPQARNKDEDDEDDEAALLSVTCGRWIYQRMFLFS